MWLADICRRVASNVSSVSTLELLRARQRPRSVMVCEYMDILGQPSGMISSMISMTITEIRFKPSFQEAKGEHANSSRS